MAKLRKGSFARSVGGYGGGGGANVALRKDDAGAYKAVKRYLNKGEGQGAVLADALVDDRNGEGEGPVIVIPRPHLVMGARRTSDLNPAARKALASVLPAGDDDRDADSLAIKPNATSPLSVATIAMDGASRPKGDDYDRVAFQMRLNSKKKVMTILPEEALALVISRCKKKIADEHLISQNGFQELEEIDEDDDGEAYRDYPPAFAIPGWVATDAAIEALIDAAGGSASPCGPTLHQRSVAACAGALLPPPTKAGANAAGPPTPSKLAKKLESTMRAKDAEAAKEATIEATARRAEPVEPDPYVPLVVLAGATWEGVELTAVQITKPQGPDEELHYPFGNINVLSSM